MLTLTSPRIHRRLVYDPFLRFQATLDEIHSDYFNGHLTSEQRRKHEMEAHIELALALNKAELVESN